MPPRMVGTWRFLRFVREAVRLKFLRLARLLILLRRIMHAPVCCDSLSIGCQWEQLQQVGNCSVLT